MVTLSLDLGAHSDAGRVREHNEDAFEWVRYTGGHALIVCDGMGGHAAGDVASTVARAALAAALVRNEYADPRELLFRAIDSAHQEVVLAAQGAVERSGMGTTAVVALVRGDALYLGHVGDSRGYLVRGPLVSQLTRDQTRVQEMVDTGLLSEDAAKSHPDAGVLAQAIGQPRGIVPFVTPEAEGIRLEIGDMLVLCTDGVYDCLEPHDILRLVQGRSAEEAAHNLVRTAVERDGQDNATAVVAIVRARVGAARSGVAPTVLDGAYGEDAAGQVSDRHTFPDIERRPRRRWAWFVGPVVFAVALVFAFFAGRYSDGARGRVPEPDPSGSARRFEAPGDAGASADAGAGGTIPVVTPATPR